MNPEYFDIHSHLNLKAFADDKLAVIARMKEHKVWTNTVGVDLETSQEAVKLADAHENLFATIGLHPNDEPGKTFNEQEFEKLVVHKKMVAIGECGLDYFVSPKNKTGLSEISVQEKARQKQEFEKQIAFAIKHHKPLMIHCRDAYPDCLDLLRSKKQEYGDKLRANFHFFTEPIETAKKILDLGFTMSFTGPITFADSLAELVAYVPVESMMAETDAPFASPVPYRGTRNEPSYVKEIVTKIADIKKKDREEVRMKLLENSLSFFGL